VKGFTERSFSLGELRRAAARTVITVCRGGQYALLEAIGVQCGPERAVGPAAVTAAPTSGTIPTGYLILNVTTGHIKRHTGGYVRKIPAA
jgi:hypothetical protein